jgi:hypothetical protein
MMTASRPALGSVIAAVLSIGSASAADNYKKLGWDWSFQKKPMAAAFVFCNNKDAPKDPSAPADKKDQPWAKVSDVIRAAADKWKYSKFQFNFAADDCSRCPPPNYIDFGTLKDTTKQAETTAPNIPGTNKMKKCAIRFNKDTHWKVDGDPNAANNEFDLLSVALHELGHCVGLDDVAPAAAPAPAANPVMSSGLKAGEKRRDLTDDDKKGRNAIYGEGQ